MKKPHRNIVFIMFLFLTNSSLQIESISEQERSYLIAGGTGRTVYQYEKFLRANTKLTLFEELDGDRGLQVMKVTKDGESLESESYICRFEPKNVLILIKANYASDVLLRKIPAFGCFDCSSNSAFSALSTASWLRLSTDKLSSDGPTFYDSSNAFIYMENISVADAICEITRQCGGREVAISFLLDEKGNVDPEMASSIDLTLEK